MNTLEFPVSFGSVRLCWHEDNLLARIEWMPEFCAGGAKVSDRGQVPSMILRLADRIRLYFYRGEPIGRIPWASLDFGSITSFQKAVYEVITAIPHGETRTYGWVATQLGNGSASRAVGQALKKNPFPILIPCHRILASSSVGGFMGTKDPAQVQVQLKQHLNVLEEEYLAPVFPFITPAAAWVGMGGVGGT